jgi:prepilin-type N-terminal cleavage/methylation domain-containing protein/prepilin-type processing-associated H-X9-DG protein
MKHGRQSVRRLRSGSSAGFSLLEMLLVIGIVLILFTLYWAPRKGSRQRALLTSCQRNLERIYIAQEIYANDHAGRFPVVAGAGRSEQVLDLLVPRYTSDTASFICPASQDTAPPGGGSFLNSKISYAYYMGRSLTNSQAALMSDAQVDGQAKAPGQLVFSSTGKPPGNNHARAGGNFLFGDGHVDASPAHSAFALPLEPGTVLLNP